MALFQALLGISLLIVLHELGHFGVARACGMRVLRFSVGFGPTLASRRVGTTLWQLAAIPMGGFVHIAGMGEGDSEDDGGGGGHGAWDPAVTFAGRPMWQRAAVVAAGPLSNWLVAAALLALVAGTSGLTQSAPQGVTLGHLAATGAGLAGGLRPGDEVRRVGAVVPRDWAAFAAEVRAHPGEALPIVVSRGGREEVVVVTPEARPEDGQGSIGALAAVVRRAVGPGAALVAGVEGAWSGLKVQAELLSRMVRGQGGGRLTGLPGIVRTMADQAHEGPAHLLEGLAWLSIGLCLLNLLPVPGLDGSRLSFLGAELLLGRPVSPRVEGTVHGIGFIALLGLTLFVSLRDVWPLLS